MADDPRPPAPDTDRPPGRSQRSLGAHSLVYLVGTALQGLGVLLVLPFATRVLGRDAYGQVATGLVVVQMVGTLAAAGLPQVILREHHRGPEGPRVARALAGTMVLLALALGAVGLGVALALSAAGHADLGRWLPLVVAAVGLTTVVSGQTLMRARLRPWGFLALAVLATVGAQLAGVVAALGEPTAERYLVAYASVVTLTAVVALVLGRPLPPTAERGRVRAGVRLAAPLLPQAVAMLGLLSGDVLLTGWLLGDAAAGEYQVALQIGNVPFVLAVALFNAWGPLVLSRPLEDRWAWTRRSGTALLVVVVVGAGLVAVAAPWVAHLLVGPGFDPWLVGITGALLTFVSVLYMLYQGSSLAVLDSERTGRLAGAALLGLGVMVGLAVLLAPSAGVTGVAVAKVAGYGVLAGVTVAVGWRDLRWPVEAAVAVLVGVVATLLAATVYGGAVAAPLLLAGAALVGRRVLDALRR